MNDQQCVILNWNVRGLNNPARRQVVKDLVRDTKATIVALQETKMEYFDRTLVCETLRDNLVVLPSVGLSGSILLAVHRDYYSVTA
jgi:hypothetical protein